MIDIDMSKASGVSNRTIIYWCTELAQNGYIESVVLNKRIREYKVI